MSWKILVVEDEQPVLDMAEMWLGNAGHKVITCTDGNQALEVFKKSKPDIVVLDWQLPGIQGIDLLPQMLAISNVPILMASAKTDIEEVERALELGAVDYIKKSYGGKELVAKINAVMTRPVRKDDTHITIGPIDIDVSAYEVRRNGLRISLTPLEFKLLLTIAETPDHTFTREELLKEVWDHKNLPDPNETKNKVDTRLVNVHIQRLRSKIEENPDEPQIVTTIRGRGYKAGV